MKKDLEKQIEKAAENFIIENTKPNNVDLEDHFINFSGGSFEKDCWVSGAKSKEAKEYWFSTFIDEIIENETFFDFASKCASKKYKVGSREHTIATMSIKFGMGCSLTKEYWQQGLYTEEEVRRLLNQCNCLSKSIEDFNEQEWFEQNKKK